MTTITLEQIKEKHAEFGQMIEEFSVQPRRTSVTVPSAEIQLQPGERYLGPLLNRDGSIECHLVWVAFEEDGLDHKAAIKWAKKVGGKLASKREIRLVEANAADLLPSSGWCWLEEEHSASFAWFCPFSIGFVHYTFRSAEGAGVAVRRVTP